MYAGNEIDFDWASLENNQKVIVRIEAVADMEGNEKVESWEFPVTCDNVAPVTGIRLWMYNNKYYVQNQINEDRFVDYTDIYGIVEDGSTTRYRVTYGGYYPAGREENATWSFSNRVTDVVSYTMDYAGNVNYLYITLSEKEDMVELDAESVNLIEGDTLQINQLYAFDTNTPIDCALTWTSSDESIVSIDESNMEYAVVTAKAVGTATITATNAYNVSDSVTINVVADDDENYAVVAFDAGTYGTLSGKSRIVVPVGYVISDEDVPEVTADMEHIFKSWDYEPVGYTVTDDITFTAEYRRNLSLEKTYIKTDTIVPGEEYLIVAEYKGKVYAMNNTPNIGGAVALKGTEVQLSKVNGEYAIVKDGLESCEWTFSTTTGGTVQHVASGSYLSTVYNSGYPWLGTSTSDNVSWNWDNAGHLKHNDTGAGEYTHLSFGISTSGATPGFDIFPVDDSAYLTIKLFKHTELEAGPSHTVTFVDGVTGQIIETQSVEECYDAVVPEAPQHEGYTFIRWDDDGKFITDDLTITAEYAINSYKVTFVDGLTNEVLDEQTVEYGSAATAPAYAEHVGYHFTGWSVEFDTISADTTVTALYELNSYTVTFRDWDGTILSTETVSHGSAATAPETPSRDYYTFLCWDTDFSSIVADTTVTAVYVENNITVYYTIVAIKSVGGTIEGPEQVQAQTDATYTITPDEGYILVDVLVDGQSVGAVETYTFENVTKGHYIQAAFHTHVYTTVVTDPTCTEGGYTTYTCDCGDTYVADYTEALGHTTELVGAKDATCDEDGYTGDLVCTVCGETVETGEVIPAHCASKAFNDVDTGKWYHAYIDYVVDNGLMVGVEEDLFAPEAAMTRAQLVTVLYRMAGSPAVETTAPFTDVKEGSFYADAVAWAYETGVAKGVTDEAFDPNTSVTREQMVTFFARYAELSGVTVTAEGDLSSFTDGSTVSAYAKAAVAWAVENGLIQGVGDNTIAPKTTANRAQVAAILTRYCEAFH